MYFFCLLHNLKRRLLSLHIVVTVFNLNNFFFSHFLISYNNLWFPNIFRRIKREHWDRLEIDQEAIYFKCHVKDLNTLYPMFV